MFYVLSRGETQPYNGGRTRDAIVEWLLKRNGPASAEVTYAALKEKIEANKYVIAYFGSEDDPLYKNAHLPYAEQEGNTGVPPIAFVHCGDAECLKEYGATSAGKIVFYRKFENRTIPYTGEPNKESLIKFVRALMVPTLFEFGEDLAEFVFAEPKPTAILFRSSSDASAGFMKTFKEAAEVHKGKMLFGYSDVQDGI